MTASDITSIVTAVVAVVGLGFSIYNFYVSRRDRRPAIIAKISNGFLTYGPELSEPMILLEVANPGEKKVIINSIHLTWKKQVALFPAGLPGTKTPPFEINPGENANFWTPLKDFAIDLRNNGETGKVKVKSCFTDAVGTTYYSKPLIIDVRQWAKDEQSRQ